MDRGCRRLRRPVIEKRTVERAFELASLCENVDKIRAKLIKEGYSSVHAHLRSASLRLELNAVNKRQQQLQ